MKCECSTACLCACRPGPAAYVIARDGATLAVCTRCLWGSDTVLEILVEAVSPQLVDYDPFGARMLRRRLQIRPRRRLA
jgi:hypothetical protein